MLHSTRLLLLFLAACISFCLISCKKEMHSPTVITGKITNKKSGALVEGAFVGCVSRGKDDIPTDRSKSSNEFGEYIIVIPAGHTFTFINVYKSGFLPNIFPLKGIDIQEGDTNVVNITLLDIFEKRRREPDFCVCNNIIINASAAPTQI